MKKIIFSTLYFVLCSIILMAQDKSEQPTKSKVIVKKITVENVNGVETTNESTDTLDISEIRDIQMEGLDFNSKELDIKCLKNGDKRMRIIMQKDGAAPGADDAKVFKLNPEHQVLWEEAVKASSPNKAVLGVQLENVDGSNGAQIIEVFQGSAAEKIGLQEGDIIISIAGKETRNVDAVIEALSNNKPGDKVKLKYLRETKQKSASAVLQERKEEAFSKVHCSPSKHCKVICCKPGVGDKCKSEEIIILKDGEGSKKIRVIRDKESNLFDNKKVIGIDKDRKVDESVNKKEEETNKELSEMNTFWENQDERSLNVEVLTGSPNPNNGQMKISFEGKKESTTIELLDLNGKEIFKERVDQFDGTYNKEIEIENAKGTLILKVTQGEKVLTQKIIVK